MKTKFFLLLSVILFAVSSCQKDKMNSPIVGYWKWIYSMEGWNGLQTPETKGYTAAVEFKSNGSYKKYQNGEVQEQGNYTLTQDSAYFPPKLLDYIEYNGGYKDVYSLSVTGDTLTIGTSDADGTSITYARK